MKNPHVNERLYINRGIQFHKSVHLPLFIDVAAHEHDIPPQAKNRFRIFYIEEGSGITILDSQMQTILPPMIVLANEQDRFRIVSPHALKMSVLYFHPDVVNSDFTFSNIRDEKRLAGFSLTARQDHSLVKNFFRPLPEKRMLTINHLASREIKHCLTEMHREIDLQTTHRWLCNSRGTLIQLLYFLNSLWQEPAVARPPILAAPKIPIAGRNEQLLGKVILYLNLNYEKDISVPFLAQQFNTNRTSLAAIFKKGMRISIISYLTKLRVEIAASLLHNTFIDIQEVLEKVGFNDKSHFGRVFKRYFGVAPKLYRKDYLSDFYPLAGRAKAEALSESRFFNRSDFKKSKRPLFSR
jgi:AraC family L-rhamnose operon regulatory protein RhaS